MPLKILTSLLLVLGMAILSFLVIRLAPGSPFSTLQTNPIQVTAAQYQNHGMGEGLVSEEPREVIEVLVSKGIGVQEGAPLLRFMDGSTYDAPIDGTIVTIAASPGKKLMPGEVFMVLSYSIWAQLGNFLQGLCSFDSRPSFRYPGRSVQDILATTLPVSMELAMWALLLGVPLGLGLGLYSVTASSSLPGRWVDRGSILLLSLTTLILGPLLQEFFVYRLGWFPPVGWDSWQHRILPVATLALILASHISRLTLDTMEITQQTPFYRAARSRGISRKALMFHYLLPPSLIPLLGYLGPLIAGLLCGSVVVEKLFHVPGVSTFFVEGAIHRDYSLIMGVLLFYSTVLVLLNFLLDALLVWLDPRISQ